MIVTLYETAIVTFDNDNIWLNSGGWWTWTTMRHMNWVSRTYNLQLQVRMQGPCQFTVAYHGQVHAFKQQTVRLNRQTGSVMPLQDTLAKNDRAQRKVNPLDFQQVVLMGNATCTAERHIARAGDITFTTFSLAVGDRRGQTATFPIVVFGRQGEAVANRIRKGQRVLVEGWIQTEKDGRFDVVARRVEMGPKPKQSASEA